MSDDLFPDAKAPLPELEAARRELAEAREAEYAAMRDFKSIEVTRFAFKRKAAEVKVAALERKALEK